MLKFFVHCYQNAEAYAVLLGWVVVPLGYYAAFLFLRNHYGLFQTEPKVTEPDGKN